MGLLLPMIFYHFIFYNNEAKLKSFAGEVNRIFELGHIIHKKVIIHAMNKNDEWYAKDSNSDSNRAERKKFISNFDCFKKYINSKSLIDAFERYFLILI